MQQPDVSGTPPLEIRVLIPGGLEPDVAVQKATVDEAHWEMALIVRGEQLLTETLGVPGTHDEATTEHTADGYVAIFRWWGE